MEMTAGIERRQVHVNGIVQGVGFRPFVFRLAQHHGLAGFVANTASGVDIEVQGSPAALDSFLRDLKQKAPPLAELTAITSRPIAPTDDPAFHIRLSTPPGQGKVATQISPDMAICSECLRELFDPADRRYRYPFINCTNCGPRYTIIENIPYDRASTSMRGFTMCIECQAEYDNPAGRRFHAQPNCCPKCGPQLLLADAAGKIRATGAGAMESAGALLQQGRILGVKGLGGFHLAADAANDTAVALLRQRKGREEKPLAVMVADLQTARRICRLQAEEERALLSMERPIVLADKKEDHFLSEAVAPGNDMFGLMLAYTPLHHLLFEHGPQVLVMTSGNLSEEPICIDNQEAFRRLAGLADYILAHDRDIYLRNDDSIVIHFSGRLRSVRRSRGYAPRPVLIRRNGPPVLGTGGELKNTVCLLKEEQAIVSQHIGDLKNLEAYLSFRKTITHLQLLFETEPELVVYDLHPDYLSTRWALEEQGAATLGVQHHHAHLASVLAENRAEGPAIGLIMDGTGYGNDGTIWGGEVLIGDCRDYTRYASFEPMPLPGGDAAIAAPWRTAVAYLAATFGRDLPDPEAFGFYDAGPILEMVAANFNTPATSSCGRLFDAVAAIGGGRTVIRYEAQAAIELMQVARTEPGRPYPYEIIQSGNDLHMSVKGIIRAVAAARQAGETLAVIAGRFHATLIALFTEVARLASRESGIRTVALSGGVFQNRLLFEGLLVALKRAGFEVLTHALVPANDGGIALGQAVIGRQHLIQK